VTGANARRFAFAVLARVSLLGLAGGCGAPSAAAPSDAAVDTVEAGLPDGGADAVADAGPRLQCTPLLDTAAYVGGANYARSPDGSAGAWFFSFEYAPKYAPAPGAAFAVIVLDRGDSLVGRTVELGSFATVLKRAPLVRPYVSFSCNGKPPCAKDEVEVSYVAAAGTATIHEHADLEGGRFSMEIWSPLLRRNVAPSGVVFSDDPKDCFIAARLHLLAPVHDVTAQCPTVQRAAEPLVYATCAFAKAAAGP